MILTALYKEFFKSEKSGGLILLLCTIVSLILANSLIAGDYIGLWQTKFAGLSVEHWINDGLMAVFFLLIGLELEREIYKGELSNLRNAMLPIVAAMGGVLIPVILFMIFNYGTVNQAGAGIPMATDIAFALGILSLLGKRVPGSLKIFLTALAVIDDLMAVLVIAIFYTKDLSVMNLLISLSIYVVLIILNRVRVKNLVPYLTGGIIMWYFMLHSGVHATIAGVMLAFVIPFRKGDAHSPSYKLQHFLHIPVAFLILPLFALANTAVPMTNDWLSGFTESLGLGILTGLAIGKPLGIVLFSYMAVRFGITKLPVDLKWKHITGTGFLAGIGFTMSMFITYLAFDDKLLINSSKIVILAASLIAGIIGYFLLNQFLKGEAKDTNE